MASIDDRKLSFKEIMDEELAKKLQADFENEVGYLMEPSQEEKDFLLALELSRESMVIDKKEEPISNHEADQLSEDYLIALQLQDNLNEEQRNYQQILQQRNENSNIQIKTGLEPLFNEDIINKNEEDDEFDEEDYYDDEEAYYFNNFHENNKSYVKPNGRMNVSEFSNQGLQNSKITTTDKIPKEFITKHDPIICGSKNTEILETQIGINCGNMIDDNISLSNPVFNELNQHAVKSETRRIRKRGKEDHETRESVMDTQTRLLLYKLLNSNMIKEIGGIISSGKEANVYRATSGEDNNKMYAIKIYKTTLNEFKNRDDYIKDDYRFKYRFNKQSSRKFIKVWAEKEMENLKRLKKYNILCPNVILLRKNVLVMEFIGKNNIPAPQLRNIKGLSIDKIFDLYIQCIKIMRIMFQQANLVHGDLSEYNILYLKGKLWIIDVAQAVEYEHPNSLLFLRRDCDNITKYFKKNLLNNIMTTRELFNYITDININIENEQLYLDKILEHCNNRKELSIEELVEEKVFLDSYIPRHLDDIEDPFLEDSSTEPKDIFHQPLTGLKNDLSQDDVITNASEYIIKKQNKEIEDNNINKQWIEKSEELSKEDQKIIRKLNKKKVKQEQRNQRKNKNNDEKEEEEEIEIKIENRNKSLKHEKK